LLVVAHHLVVDAISWRILLEDLRSACEQAPEGEIRLPVPTTPFQAWARALVKHAASDEARQELDFWTAQPWREAVPVRIDAASGDNTVSSVARLAATLDEDETTALLTHAPERLAAQPNELLLASLCRAVGAWTGNGSVLFDVAGHGRDPVTAGIDLSRTVGWFTTIFPLLLESPAEQRSWKPWTAFAAGFATCLVADSGSAFCGISRGMPASGSGCRSCRGRRSRSCTWAVRINAAHAGTGCGRRARRPAGTAVRGRGGATRSRWKRRSWKGVSR
jgi:hypothetical protein